MPKIVDHEAHSVDLARRAVRYFSDHGYAGTSMRKVAAYLGLSKSALYHYFPTKESLFLACTRQVMARFDADQVALRGTEEENLARTQLYADAVKAWFVARGVDADLITAVGLGESQLNMETGDEVEQPLNRFVEIEVRSAN